MVSEKKVNEYVQSYISDIDSVSYNKDTEAKKTIWRRALELIYRDREDILYKKKKDGDYVYNKNGFKKINFFGIIFHLAQLIGGFVAEQELRKRLKETE